MYVSFVCVEKQRNSSDKTDGLSI